MRAITQNGRADRCGSMLAVLLGVVLMGAPSLAEDGQAEKRSGGESSAESETADLEAVLSSEDGPTEAESSDGDASNSKQAPSAGSDEDGTTSAVDEYLRRLQSANEAGGSRNATKGPAAKKGDRSGDFEGNSAVSRAAGGVPEKGAKPNGGAGAKPDGASGAGRSSSGGAAERGQRRSVPEPPELEVLEPEEAEALTSAEARQRAVRILVRAAVAGQPALRSNAIEALSLMPGRALPLTNKALNDPNAGVRFAAAVTAARLGFKSLVPTLRPLLNDENSSVQAAALSALHKLGEDVNLTPLAGMLRSQDPQLRANVALLLGLLGDDSAVPMLQRAASAPLRRASAARAAVVRVQVAEAIARLNSDTALDALRAGMFSQFGEVRVVAVNAMGAIGDQRMEPALSNLLRDELPVELQLAASASLARMGSAEGLDRVLEETEHERPAIRAQAAWALGWFKGDAGRSALKRMLADDSRQVRVSAAASVLRRAGGGSGG